MELKSNSMRMKVFIGESDKIGHSLLYEKILVEAKQNGLAGCTVLRGIMSYGTSSTIHVAKLIDISEDLPIVIEMVDEEKKINDFLTIINDLFNKCGCGGMITIEKVNTMYYKPVEKGA